MGPETLRDHVLGSYFTLRWGLAIAAISFPWLLAGVAKLWRSIPMQASVSAYYHAGDGTMRNAFVGVLFAIGAVLYIYKGFSRAENIALNLAGILLVIVALSPMEWNCRSECARLSLHAVAAVLFFLCIAYVAWWRAKDTRRLLDPKLSARYRKLYRGCGVALVVSPLAAVAVNAFAQRLGQTSSIVFYIEALAAGIFGVYWIIKGWELKESCADLLSVQEKTVRAKVPTPDGDLEAAIVKTSEVGTVRAD